MGKGEEGEGVQREPRGQGVAASSLASGSAINGAFKAFGTFLQSTSLSNTSLLSVLQIASEFSFLLLRSTGLALAGLHGDFKILFSSYHELCYSGCGKFWINAA